MKRKLFLYSVASILALAASSSVAVTGAAAQSGFCGGADIVVIVATDYKVSFIQTAGEGVRSCTVVRYSDGNLSDPTCGQWR